MRITKKDKRTNLEKEIDEVLMYMSGLSPDSKEYSTISSNLEKLYKAKAEDKACRIKLDTVAVVVGNLAGILLILGYEKANIITTKALGFVVKGRV